MEIHELYSSRISLCANFLYIYSVNVYTTPLRTTSRETI